MKKSFLFTTLVLICAGIIMFGGACAWEKINSNQNQDIELEENSVADSQLIGGGKAAGDEN